MKINRRIFFIIVPLLVVTGFILVERRLGRMVPAPPMSVQGLNERARPIISELPRPEPTILSPEVDGAPLPPVPILDAPPAGDSPESKPTVTDPSIALEPSIPILPHFD